MPGNVSEASGAERLRIPVVSCKRESLPQAVILLGGKGTRIQSLYSDRPKCLVPVAGRPFLLWQLEWVKRSGLQRIHLAAGYMAGVLREWVAANAPADMEITVSVEPEARGTGGAIRFAEPWIQSDPFFVLNGDSLAPGLDFQALLNAHDTAGAQLIMIGVAKIDKTGRYGTVEFDAAGRVTAFLEKAERDNGWINTGVYCINRQALELIAPKNNVSLETDIFPGLAKDGQLYARPVPSPLLDMGTPEGLQEMTDWLETQNRK